MNEIEIFNFGSDEVRVVMINGEPWWVANDVCAVLGLANPRSSLALLSDDQRGVHTMDATSDQRGYNIISESGLYSLILRSRKPEAKRFQRWVTGEVLPAIRRTGRYATGGSRLDAIQAMVDQLREQERIADEHDARLAALEENYGRVTALGYAKMNGLPDSVKYLNRLGRAASQIAQEQGVSVEKAHSTMFGTVNAWPEDIWDDALERMNGWNNAQLRPDDDHE